MNISMLVTWRRCLRPCIRMSCRPTGWREATCMAAKASGITGHGSGRSSIRMWSRRGFRPVPATRSSSKFMRRCATQGAVLVDHMVGHIFTIENGLIIQVRHSRGLSSMSMSTSPIAVDPPNLDPGIMKYLQDPPPPRSAVDEGDFSNAFNHLDQAARLAVAKDAAGNRWVPGLSIVVVRPDAGILHAEYHCYGTKNIDKDTAAPVGADTLFRAHRCPSPCRRACWSPRRCRKSSRLRIGMRPCGRPAPPGLSTSIT